MILRIRLPLDPRFLVYYAAPLFWLRKARNCASGSGFDADLHEAIATIPAPADDLKGKIIDTTQKGYMINDKVLRHAKVVVGE